MPLIAVLRKYLNLLLLSGLLGKPATTSLAKSRSFFPSLRSPLQAAGGMKPLFEAIDEIALYRATVPRRDPCMLLLLVSVPRGTLYRIISNR